MIEKFLKGKHKFYKCLLVQGNVRGPCKIRQRVATLCLIYRTIKRFITFFFFASIKTSFISGWTSPLNDERIPANNSLTLPLFLLLYDMTFVIYITYESNDNEPIYYADTSFKNRMKVVNIWQGIGAARDIRVWYFPVFINKNTDLHISK